MKKSLFTIIQWTWGLPQTLIGSAVYILNRDKKHFDFNGACATVWNREDGISLGKFIFVPGRDEGRHDGSTIVSRELTEHEYGHSMQSLMLGPLYLPVVGLPSLVWSRLPYFEKKRRKSGRSYYSPYFERTANVLSAAVIGKKGNVED